MLSSLGRASILVAGVSALVRPELPVCKCLETWPGSDNATRWAETFGSQDPSLGWALDRSVTGCTCVNFGGGPCEYQFCVPDTSNGSCIAEGSWDSFIQMPTINCGTWTSPTDSNASAPNVEPTENQRVAAQAFADSVATAPQNELCKCKADWSDTKLATTYCGGNSSLALGAVSQSECPTAPLLITSKDGDGKWTGNYLTTGQVFPMSQWCAVDVPTTGSCDVKFLGRAACAEDEVWMIYPNSMTVKEQGDKVVVDGQRLSMKVSPLTTRGGYSSTLWMTFPAVPSDSMGVDWQTWFKDDYDKYEKTNQAKVDELLACDADCEAQKANQAAVLANRSAELEEQCKNNTKCNAKLDAVKCSAVQDATTAACDADSVCKARAEEKYVTTSSAELATTSSAGLATTSSAEHATTSSTAPQVITSVVFATLLGVAQ